MCDLQDVVDTFIGVINGIIYPNGTNNPSISGVTTQIFGGWPDAAQLDANMKAGITSVNVYPRNEERNTTRYAKVWQPVALNTPTLFWQLVGLNLTLSGAVPNVTANNPHNIMIMFNGKPYIYGVQPTDTLASACAALAGLAGIASTGATLNFSPGSRVTATRIGIFGTSAMEIRRQERQFQIGIWAPSPQERTATAKPIDLALADTNFLVMPDLSAGRLIYKSSHESDKSQQQLQFRRDLFCTVEYPTLKFLSVPQILAEVINVDAAIAGVPPAIPVVTINI